MADEGDQQLWLELLYIHLHYTRLLYTHVAKHIHPTTVSLTSMLQS